VHNTFQAISFGAGPEVRPEKSVFMRVQETLLLDTLFSISGLEASN
jgi:hypothetical protein